MGDKNRNVKIGDTKNQLNAILHRKNVYPYYGTEYYLSVIFFTEKFREVLKLPDFGIKELDAELLLESENIRAGEKSIYRSELLRKLIVQLCRRMCRSGMTENSYNRNLFEILNRRLPENEQNPMGCAEDVHDFHKLPTEVKLWIMWFLSEHLLARYDLENVDQYNEAEDLRVEKIGMDSIGNSYYYFGELQLYVEYANPLPYLPTLDRDFVANKPWRKIYETFTKCSRFLCIASVREQWYHAMEVFSTSRNSKEKELGKAIKKVFDIKEPIYQSLLAERTRISNEALRLQWKKEADLRKELGLVRTSSRLQAKSQEREEQMKRMRELEREEREQLKLEGKLDLRDMTPPPPKSREERRLQREAAIAQEMERQRAMESAASTSTASDSESDEPDLKKSRDTLPKQDYCNQTLHNGSTSRTSLPNHDTNGGVKDTHISTAQILPIKPTVQNSYLIAKRFFSNEMKENYEKYRNEQAWTGYDPYWPEFEHVTSLIEHSEYRSRMYPISVVNDLFLSYDGIMPENRRRLLLRCAELFRVSYNMVYEGQAAEDETCLRQLNNLIKQLSNPVVSNQAMNQENRLGFPTRPPTTYKSPVEPIDMELPEQILDVSD